MLLAWSDFRIHSKFFELLAAACPPGQVSHETPVYKTRKNKLKKKIFISQFYEK